MSVSLTSTSTSTTLSSNGVDVFSVGSDNEAQARVNGVMQPLSSLASIGIGQTWQTVTRSSGVTYTNTTGKPIMLQIAIVTSTSGGAYMTTISVNGETAFPLLAAYSPVTTAHNSACGSIIIPDGATYLLTDSGSGFGSRTSRELRG